MSPARPNPLKLGLTVALLLLSLGQARAATLETIPTRPGITETFILIPAQGGPAKASVILLVGGDGHMGLSPARMDNPSGNFLARSRDLFAAHGLQVALLDTPSDHRELGDWRVSADHAADLAALIRYLHAKSHVPVWLVGTSRGSVSAANTGARLAQAPADSRPDGLVLTSSVTIPAPRGLTTVFSSDLTAVRVPVLVVAHRDDRCPFAPPSNAAKIAASLPNAPKAEAMLFDGGDPPRSDACQPFAQHGYLGIEQKVVDAISDWILAH
jgi:pimeloyl-ACP methyl ester carboxylesterase